MVLNPVLYFLLQIIYDITGWDTRTIFTWSALLMQAYILDEELEKTHKWHIHGGASDFFK